LARRDSSDSRKPVDPASRHRFEELASDRFQLDHRPAAGNSAHSSNSGTGNTGEFKIVGFAGVTIVEATGSGSNVSIVFQPSVLIDPTATTSTTTSTVTQFVYPQVPVVLVR
jgi:hypothetical protein